jgi:Protein of unknown function (DUF3703)
MPVTPQLREPFALELRLAEEAEAHGDLSRAWNHLERAHVLSQRHAGPHVLVHRKMLGFAWRRRDARELIGQLVRVLVAGPGSWLGRAPIGNTGGADVGIFEPMPIPQDLARLLGHEPASDSSRDGASSGTIT